VLKLRILRQGNFPGLYKRDSNLITRVLLKWRLRETRHRKEGNVTSEAEIRVIAHQPRNANCHQKLR
jgi:hypothetical protein